MEQAIALFYYVVPFLAVLTAIIYVHELGHYWVARWNGIRVETFSIGFGPELIGWDNRHGTRWKIAAIPLGGYVKFFGDASAVSNATEDIEKMTPEERAVSFHFKGLAARAAVVVAGPLANFLFAIAVYAVLFATVGQPFSPPVVGGVVAGGAAEAAGFRANDRVLTVDGNAIERFEELRAYVALRAEAPIEFVVDRDGRQLNLTVTPRRIDVPDGFGGTLRMGQIGIQGGVVVFVQHGPSKAIWQAVRETGAVIGSTMTYLERILRGQESGDQIAGPLGMAKMSADMSRLSVLALVSLMATISVAVGLINLFPIPLMDGGHLLFYAIEAIRGRPLGPRVQEYGFRIGLALVMSLFIFATWNDLNRLQFFNFLANLFS